MRDAKKYIYRSISCAPREHQTRCIEFGCLLKNASMFLRLSFSFDVSKHPCTTTGLFLICSLRARLHAVVSQSANGYMHSTQTHTLTSNRGSVTFSNNKRLYIASILGECGDRIDTNTLTNPLKCEESFEVFLRILRFARKMLNISFSLYEYRVPSTSSSRRAFFVAHRFTIE